MSPFLKWAGGKRWLFGDEFLSNLPFYRRYIEPFLGGGAGFFAINPANAILADINPDLIELYEVVRDQPTALEHRLKRYQSLHSPEHYYRVRERNPRTPLGRAVKLLYLNRTCWNGLYRLNKLGNFNVPIGTKTAVILPTDNFQTASNALKSCQLIACDFDETIQLAGKEDLLFVDPPYTVKHNNNGFVKYNETIFSWSDQVRLRDALSRAVDRGASVILTNANHVSIRELYSGFGSHVVVERSSVISGKLSGRTSISELLVRA